MENKDQKLKTPSDIVQKIMEQHLDLAACNCWICRHGRSMGVRSSFDSGFERMPVVKFFEKMEM